ncbi:MAG TPA: carboxymuconolactone decarboxylase family protein [Candidatus Binatia bacterium]|jgi:alkylhydroperoxidase family enzyme|nr:carboxymuconolactone decarboxylase family protein [Candidatus Binatia bacterium]
MRLTAIESPRNPILRALYRLTQRQFGRTMTPFKVIFARLPWAIPGQLGIYVGLGKRLPLDPALQLLLQHHVARLNGCAFCDDIGRAMAVYQNLSPEKLDATEHWRTSLLFTTAERAALAYVEEATQTKRASDDTFAALRAHFDDRQIVAITWINAVENYFNLLNGPLGIESDGLCAIAEQRTRRRTSGAVTAAGAA